MRSMPCNAQRTPLPIMILAHNEESHIERCLDSIYLAEPDTEFEIFVMANGCADGTEELVRAYGKNHPTVHLISLALGDKCNAWNEFVHVVVPKFIHQCEICFFMDGDARAGPLAFSALAHGLDCNPRANAAAAVPISGRNAARYKSEIILSHGLVANLYALRGSLIDRIIESNIKLPLHLEGDDGLIGALVKWDLDPINNLFDDDRIVPCPEAGYAFESMSMHRLRDWRAYWARTIRYARGRYEFELLGRRLSRLGIAGMPHDIRDLYHEASGLLPRSGMLGSLTSRIALRRMRLLAKRPPADFRDSKT